MKNTSKLLVEGKDDLHIISALCKKHLLKENFEIKKGDRIAQAVLNKFESAEIEEAEELSESVRGEGGFGSSGI